MILSESNNIDSCQRIEKLVFVAVIFYHYWPKLMLRSLREHFPLDELILVNHLKMPMPHDYYDDNCTIIEAGQNGLSHGDGIDTAVNFLKKRGDKCFIHIEPDCYISGRRWAIDLLEAVQNGNEMAGLAYTFDGGPIHPCGTAWIIDKIHGSFNGIVRQDITRCDLYNYRKFIDFVVSLNATDDLIMFLTECWDTGCYNWYLAAISGKAACVPCVENDFAHFFLGRNYTPKERFAINKFKKYDYLVSKYELDCCDLYFKRSDILL